MKTPSMPSLPLPQPPSLRPLVALALAIGLGGTALAQDAADPAGARQKVAMCIGCHGITGYQASFPEVHKVPKISGQNAKYIAAALTAYRKGERKHPTMKGVAATLTDQDIADIAAFYEANGKGLAAASPAPAARSVQPPALQPGRPCANLGIGKSRNLGVGKSRNLWF